MIPMPANFADAPDSPESQSYNRLRRSLSVADAVLALLFMALLLLTDWTGSYRNFASHITGYGSYRLALLVYVTLLVFSLKALSIPLDLYAFRLEHRYHLSNQGFGAWMWDQIKGLLLGLLISAIMAELFYFLARWAPQTWWLWGWAAFMAVTVLFAHIAPVVFFPIFYTFQTLKNEALRDRLTRLSQRAGTRVRGVYEWFLSEKSRKANAALMGLGRTRRIVISDTLLTGYSDDEIEAVLAHELGHHVHRHILKGILVQALLSFFGFWVFKLVVRWAALDRHPWLHNYPQTDFANLPLIVLTATVMSLALLPFLNAFSRFHERQADSYAFGAIARVEPFISAMDKLAAQNLAQRHPPRWIEILFYSHPPISRRIIAAERWAARQRRPVAAPPPA